MRIFVPKNEMLTVFTKSRAGSIFFLVVIFGRRPIRVRALTENFVKWYNLSIFFFLGREKKIGWSDSREGGERLYVGSWKNKTISFSHRCRIFVPGKVTLSRKSKKWVIEIDWEELAVFSILWKSTILLKKHRLIFPKLVDFRFKREKKVIS